MLVNVPQVILERFEGTAPYADSSSADFQHFSAALAKAGLGAPETQDPNRYDAAWLLALAIQKAGSPVADDVKAELGPVSRKDADEPDIHVGEWDRAKQELLAGRDVN